VTWRQSSIPLAFVLVNGGRTILEEEMDVSPPLTERSASVPVAEKRLRVAVARTPYQQYVYGYPHKTAYRSFFKPLSLQNLWAGESLESRFLYVHVPFCEMRCGFCNLFTVANPLEDVVERFLAQLECEAEVTSSVVPKGPYVGAALGGGTPTFLAARQLVRVVEMMTTVMGASLGRIPFSVELSPDTVSAERLNAVSVASRLSLGVQSFLERETATLKRPQASGTVTAALDLIRERTRAALNVDLIYGIEGQDEHTLIRSLQMALMWRPEELYLYPLYVRPLTFLGKHPKAWDDHRQTLYRTGRDWLVSHGYLQRSMRVFQRRDAVVPEVPEFSAETGSTLGLGVGARSYTRRVHYAHDWAVQPRAVRSIIDAYLSRPAASFLDATSGYELDLEEEQRRFVVLTLFANGVDEGAFQRRFGAPLLDALPWLSCLVTADLAQSREGVFQLTARGLELSDAIGPWLFSETVNEKMRKWVPR
jgi:oxygen-independent coproporphyrinogen-3 oxidase